MVLLAMIGAEYRGAPDALLIAGGLSVAGGRLLHLVTLVRSGFGLGRTLSMVLTLVPMGFSGVWALLGPTR